MICLKWIWWENHQIYQRHVELKNLGLVDVILEIKITKTSEGLILSQSNYVKKILEKFD